MTLKPLFLVLLFAAPVAHAQITLTQADLVGQVTQSSTATTFETSPSATLATLAAAEGAGQTWDFSTLTYPTTYTAVNEVVQPPVLGSDDPHLGAADIIVRTGLIEADSTAFLFYDLDETSLMLRGASAMGEVDGEPGAVLVRVLPGSRFVTFPLTFESAWTDEVELQITPIIEEVRLEQREENEVVGWGTLVTPAGSAEALMLQTRTLQTVRIVSADPDTSFVVDQDSSISITYVSRDGLGASVELDGLGNVEGGSYTVQTLGTAEEPGRPTEAALSAAVYPNPVSRSAGQEVTLAYTTAASSPVRIEVYDLLGRSVTTVFDGPQSAGSQHAVWRVSEVPTGLYIVRIIADSRTVTRRVTVIN